MEENMGLADRIARVVIAIVMIVLYGTGVVGGTLGIVFLVLSVVFLLTGIISICPLYLPLGIRTTKRTSKQ